MIYSLLVKSILLFSLATNKPCPIINNDSIESMILTETNQNFSIDSKIDSMVFVFSNTSEKQSFYFNKKDFPEVINNDNFYYVRIAQLEEFLGNEIFFDCANLPMNFDYNESLTSLLNVNEPVIFLVDELDFQESLPVYLTEEGKVIVPIYVFQKSFEENLSRQPDNFLQNSLEARDLVF